MYYYKLKKKLNLDSPIDYNEKLMWLKLNKYNQDPLVKICSDKFLVRNYLSKLGYSYLLNGLISVSNKPKEIVWSMLPDKFAIKLNFGNRYNIICNNKSSCNENQTKKKLKRWFKMKFHLYSSELQYKVEKKMILIEKYIEPTNGIFPEDYKVYCFNGQPYIIGHFINRNEKTMKVDRAYFDLKWRLYKEFKFNQFVDLEQHPIPSLLDQMLLISKELSKPFPFVRIDFYINQSLNKLIFGEFTFTPSSCMANYFTDEGLIELGSLIDLESYSHEI